MTGSIARSVLWKAVTYRLGSVLITLAVAYSFLGRVETASGFTLLGHLLVTVWYIVHEKLWKRRLT